MRFPLKVIGAGLGRTGTTSFKTRPEFMSAWLAFTTKDQALNVANVSESALISQWKCLLPDYVACVDEPASWYWKQLWEMSPDALVILSIRDSQSWWESVESVTLQIKKEKSQPELLTAARREYLTFLYAMYPGLNAELSREKAIASFEEHNREVLAYAEQNEKFKRRLLVWHASEGWEPICQSLNLPVPDIPFPHKNRRNEYHGY